MAKHDTHPTPTSRLTGIARLLARGALRASAIPGADRISDSPSDSTRPAQGKNAGARATCPARD